MDVWTSYTSRKTPCWVCKEVMEQGERIIRIQFKKRMDENTYTVRGYQHFGCWVENAEIWFESHPYIPPVGNGGRPCMNLTEEDMRVRRSLAVQASGLRKRKKDMVGMGLWENVERIEEDINRLRIRYEEHGGVPRSENWN